MRKDFHFSFKMNDKNRDVYNAICSSNAVCLHIRRGDYLSAEYKTESIKLKFTDSLTFSETGEHVPFENLLPISSDNETKYNAIVQFKSEGLTLDEIAKKIGYKDKSGVSKFLARYEKTKH